MDPIGADRQPVLQGLLPRHARPAPAHDRRRALEPAVRHRPRRREHVHVVPLRDRRPPAPAVDRARPTGCHCENTKVWPYCLAGAGLGLQLHDLLRGTDHHEVFHRWWNDTCRTKYLHLDGDELPQMVTLYYDPILDVHHEVPVMVGMVPAIYLAPQVPDEARRAVRSGHARRSACGSRTGRSRRPATPRARRRTSGSRRSGASTRSSTALDAAIDEHCEPTWDAARGEFTWGFELDEPHPRGSVQRHDGGRAGRDRGFVVAARERRARQPLRRADGRRRRLPDGRAAAKRVGTRRRRR